MLKLFNEIDQDENNRRRSLIISLRNIQSMVIEGYEMFSNKQEYDSKLKEVKKEYLELILDKMPTSWINQPVEEIYFDQFLETSTVKYTTDITEKKIMSLSNALQEFKDQADQITLMKIEKYVNNLCVQNLTTDENDLLENFIVQIFDKNILVNYFLAYIDFKIELQGSNQLKLDKNAFVVIKDKFLNILSKIDSNDIRISLVGLLLHDASRIYYECRENESKKQDLVSLIEHIDCPILKEFKIWEVYFIHRVNKSAVLYNVLNKNHPLFSLDSNEKIIKLAESTFRQVVKVVKEGENLHNVALKEIAYYLIMLKNMSENSTEILLKIYVKYSIEKNLMEGILSIHKSCAGAFIQDRIDDILKSDLRAKRTSSQMATNLAKSEDQSIPYIFEQVFTRTLPFLDLQDKSKLLYLNTTLSRRLKPVIQEDFLSFELPLARRAKIYCSLIPPRFIVRSAYTEEHKAEAYDRVHPQRREL